MKYNEYLDTPNVNSRDIGNVVDVELDNYDKIGTASISINTYVNLLMLLLDKRSDFFIWYNRFKNNATDIMEQYLDLEDSMFFNDNIETIRDLITDIVDQYQSVTQYQNANIIPTSLDKEKTPALKIQVGGNDFDVVTFIVGGFKYLCGDDDETHKYTMDPYERLVRPLTSKNIMNDKYNKIFHSHFANQSINQTHLNYIDPDTYIFDYKQTEHKLKYINNVITLIKFILVDIELMIKNKHTSYTHAINDSVRNYIYSLLNKQDLEDYKRFVKECFDDDDNDNDNDSSSDALIKSRQCLMNKSKYMDEQLERERARIRSVIRKNRNKIDNFDKDLNTAKDQNELVRQTIKKTRKEANILLKENQYLYTQNKTIQIHKNIPIYEQKQYLEENQQPEIKINDVSGNEKPHQRRVFLIKGLKDYAIKISTSKFPEYEKEGIIYKIFGQIIDDPVEDNASNIRDQVLNYYFLQKIKNVAKSDSFKIYLDNESYLIINKNKCAELFDAIKQIAKITNVDEIIYYTTENVLGKFITFDQYDRKKMTNGQLCILHNNIINLLMYLNKRYNFIHWDLHLGNIFVKINNPTEFKIYDFDFSEISYKNINIVSINNHYVDMMDYNFPQLEYKQFFSKLDRPDRSLVGLFFDIVRFYYSFRSRELKCNNVPVQLLINKLRYFININKNITRKYDVYASMLQTSIDLYEDKDSKKLLDDIDIFSGGNNDQYFYKYLKYLSKINNLSNY